MKYDVGLGLNGWLMDEAMGLEIFQKFSFRLKLGGTILTFYSIALKINMNTKQTTCQQSHPVKRGIHNLNEWKIFHHTSLS